MDELPHTIGGYYCRPFTLHKPRDKTETHKHNFFHLTVIFGDADVEMLREVPGLAPEDFPVERTTRTYGGEMIGIAAGVWHRIRARQGNVRCRCVYVHRDEQGQVCDHDTGWEPGRS